jgi:hypothetical protein
VNVSWFVVPAHPPADWFACPWTNIAAGGREIPLRQVLKNSAPAATEMITRAKADNVPFCQIRKENAGEPDSYMQNTMQLWHGLIHLNPQLSFT